MDIDPDKPPESYRKFTEAAFEALPAFRAGVVRRPFQWNLGSRHLKRLVIKEVNPLAADWLIRLYRPRIVYIIRHPAAVALSYSKLGWTDRRFDEIFGHGRLLEGSLAPWSEYIKSANGFWEYEGIRQGAVLRIIKTVLQHYKDCKIVTYEDLCKNPVTAFHDLFDFAGIQWDDSIAKMIEERSAGLGDTRQPYGTSRASAEMADKWRDSIGETELEQVRSGYSRFDLPWYGRESDWRGSQDAEKSVNA